LIGSRKGKESKKESVTLGMVSVPYFWGRGGRRKELGGSHHPSLAPSFWAYLKEVGRRNRAANRDRREIMKPEKKRGVGGRLRTLDSLL